MSPTAPERLHGRNQPSAELRWLRAGPLEVALDGGDLRYFRLGEVELVRRVYVAVRDVNWDTIVEAERETTVEEAEAGFTVSSHVVNRRGPIVFAWDGRIEGSADGTISFALDGRCESSFEFAKIGICVHHPIRECAGRPYAALTPAGQIHGVLPDTIGPQLADPEHGVDLPLFDPFDGLTIELAGGASVSFAFEGQLFEMEDQRNWTDASLKTASTPAYLGYVHQALPGLAISQRVEISHRTPSAAQPRRRRTNTGAIETLTLREPLGRPLPPIGFGLPSDGRPHSPHERDRIAALRPAHLRADIDAGEPRALAEALKASAEVGAKLELGLHVDRAQLDAADGLRDQLADMSVARILVIVRGAATTPRTVIETVRRALPDGIPIVGGTDVNFCDINRDRPDVAGLDGVAYSINGQVHAFDELSLVESLAGQADTVVSARAIFPGTPIVVSPVTLRPRFNPAAVSDVLPADEPELPWAVDPRQMSDFGAVWTLGSVRALAGGGASSLTYFETVGWRGLAERDGGSPHPELFPSTPGMVFPMYELFIALSDWHGAELVDVAVSDPLRITALALRKGGDTRLIAGNLSHRPTTAVIAPRGTRVDLEPYAFELVDAS